MPVGVPAATLGRMAIHTGPVAPTDQTSTTRGLLIASIVVAVPQLAFAVLIVVYTWIDTAGMTARERADSWADIGYYIAGLIAVAPVVAGVLAGAAWGFRERVLGVALALCSLVVAALPVLFWAGLIVRP